MADPVINPVPVGLVSASGVPTPAFQQWLQQAYMLLFAGQQSGTTAQRPLKGLYIGRPYFDTTLGIPIWVQSVTASVAVWCNATGGAV